MVVKQFGVKKDLLEYLLRFSYIQRRCVAQGVPIDLIIYIFGISVEFWFSIGSTGRNRSFSTGTARKFSGMVPEWT